MAEWLKAHAWKACLGETLTWVRIPLSPPRKFCFQFPAKSDCPKHSYQFQTELSSNSGGCALHGMQRHARILGVQQAIERSPAGLDPLRHRGLGKTVFLHCGLDLVRQNLLQRLFLARFQNAFLGQESIERRADFPFPLRRHVFYSTSFQKLNRLFHEVPQYVAVI